MYFSTGLFSKPARVFHWLTFFRQFFFSAVKGHYIDFKYKNQYHCLFSPVLVPLCLDTFFVFVLLCLQLNTKCCFRGLQGSAREKLTSLVFLVVFLVPLQNVLQKLILWKNIHVYIYRQTYLKLWHQCFV